MRPYVENTKMVSSRMYNTKCIFIDKRKKPIKASVDVILTEEDFTKSMDVVKVLPNTPPKIIYPDFRYDFNTKHVKPLISSERNEFFTNLKTQGVLFTKLIDLSKVEEFASKKILYDATRFRREMNEFVSRRRAGTSALMWKFSSQFLKTFFEHTSSLKKRLFIEVTNDFFMQGLRAGMKTFKKDFLELMGKQEVYFFIDNPVIGRIAYRPSFTKEELPRIMRFIEAMLKHSNSQEVVSGEEIIKSFGFDLDTSAHANDSAIASELEVVSKDSTDVDDVEVEQPSSDNKEEVESEEPSLTNEDEENEEFNIDIDNVLQSSSSLDEEEEALTKRKEEFFAKMLPYQEKALSAEETFLKNLDSDTAILPTVIDDPNIMNKDIKEHTMDAQSRQYWTKHFRRDLLNIIKSVNNDPEFPAVITDYKITDSSDVLSKKDELSVTFVDINHKRHTFKVDIPRLSRDGFIYLNGSKRFIAKQATLLPVIKETSDRVQITTNYRKAFLYRKGDKINATIDRVMKALLSLPSDSPIKVAFGNSVESNSEHHTSLAYNYLAKKFFKVDFPSYAVKGSGSCTFFFNQDNARDVLGKFGKDPEYNPVAAYFSSNGTPIKAVYEKKEDHTIYTSKDGSKFEKDSPNYTQWLVKAIQPTDENGKPSLYYTSQLGEIFATKKGSTSLAYSEVKIVSNSFFLAPIIAFFLGIIPMLERAKIPYRISEKRSQRSDSESVLEFKDGYIYMDSRNQPENELLINGLVMALDTRGYTIDECKRLSPVFLDYFEGIAGTRNVGKALLNFEASMIDPITKEILHELSLPENFIDLLIYGNYLLRDFTKSRKNDLGHYRIRDAETISAVVYNSLADAFANYKRTVRGGSPQPISVPKNDVLKRITSGTPNIEGYSTLNPFLEAEIKSKSTFKGVSGANSSDAYTPDFRAYHESMLGVYGIYTPIGPEVGVNRSMVMKPRYDNIRGYLKPLDLKKAGAANLFAVGEMLNVFTPKHADAPRVVMASVQGKHLTPTIKQHTYLVGSGVDKALAHMLSQDFAYKAVTNGVVESIDMEKQLCVIAYSDGTKGIIDISSKPAKNSGGGFYIENRLTLNPKVKVGYKFKQGEILAKDENFFRDMADGSTGFAAGRLSKIALLSLPETFEDSSVVTNAIVEDMASYVTNKRDIVLRRNSRIISSKKVGDQVSVNDPLLIYEDVGDNEASAIEALEKLDADTKTAISELARSTIKAKYSGEIDDIRIYYNAELSDMHPSLRRLVEDYIRKYKAKANVIMKGRGDEIVQQPSVEKIESDKIAGSEVDGVIIEYYITHLDRMGVGNKVTAFTSLKTIIAETIPKGLEPFSEYGSEDEHVDFFISPMSVVSRMVPDFFLLGYSNKVLVNLKQQCLDILELGK